MSKKHIKDSWRPAGFVDLHLAIAGSYESWQRDRVRKIKTDHLAGQVSVDMGVDLVHGALQDPPMISVGHCNHGVDSSKCHTRLPAARKRVESAMEWLASYTLVLGEVLKGCVTANNSNPIESERNPTTGTQAAKHHCRLLVGSQRALVSRPGKQGQQQLQASRAAPPWPVALLAHAQAGRQPQRQR